MNDILSQITSRVEEMPRVSETPYRLLKVLAQKDYSIDEVIQIVEADVSLTAQCLKMVNSAAYALLRQVNSIKQAVVLLGSQTLVRIALAHAFKSIFMTSMKGYSANPHDFWEHSVRTAIMARVISQKTKLKIPPDFAYTAGLLHDIGKAIISEFFDKYYSELVEEMDRKESGDFLEIEHSILGTDHTLVGEAMARKWGLSDDLQAVIRYHHHLSECPKEYSALTGLVHVADILTMMSGSGTGVDTLAYSLDKSFAENISLDRKMISELVFEADMEYLKIKNRLNIFVGD